MKLKHRSAFVVLVAVYLMACSSEASGDEASRMPSVAVDDSWLALVDGDDPGGETHDEEPRRIHLSDFGADERPDTRIIMLLAAAGWCAPCQSEAAALNDFAADYESRGVAVLTAVFQDPNAKPASLEFVRKWAETFELTVPTIIDSDFKTSKYFDSEQMPAAMLLDASDLKVLAIGVGADLGDDPLGKYRDLLDFHLSKHE